MKLFLVLLLAVQCSSFSMLNKPLSSLLALQARSFSTKATKTKEFCVVYQEHTSSWPKRDETIKLLKDRTLEGWKLKAFSTVKDTPLNSSERVDFTTTFIFERKIIKE